MNVEAAQYLAQILAMDMNALTQFHIEFLKARRDYLTETQREKYAELLGEKKEQMSFSALKEQAKALGLKVRVGITTEELQQLVNQAQA